MGNHLPELLDYVNRCGLHDDPAAGAEAGELGGHVLGTGQDVGHVRLA